MKRDFKVWLQSQMDDKGWSQKELARRSGISQPLISLIISGNRQPSWDACAALASALGTSPVEVFVMAELLPNGNGKIEWIRDLAARLPTDKQEDALWYIKALGDK